MITEMSLFCVNQSAARTKKSAKSIPVTRDDVVHRMRGGVQRAAGGPDLDANINALLSLRSDGDVVMVSDDSDDDDDKNIILLRENIVKSVARNFDKEGKKRFFEDSFRKDKEALAQLGGGKKPIKGSTRDSKDDLIDAIKERMTMSKGKIKGYESDLKTIDAALKAAVKSQFKTYSKTADHTDMNINAVRGYIGNRLADYSITDRYSNLITELVTKEYQKKFEKMNADAENSNKKMIKDLISSHLKIVDVNDVSHPRCMMELQKALPHIPGELWQADVYGAFVQDLINEHKAKHDMKSSKFLQSNTDKDMKKQIKELVLLYAKDANLENITIDNINGHLVANLQNDCGHIARYKVYINDCIEAAINKKMGQQKNSMKIVKTRKNKARIRAIISTYLKEYDIFNNSPIVIPDTITPSDREKYDEFVCQVVNQDLTAKARKKLRESVTEYMKGVTSTDLAPFNYELAKAHVVKSFHSTDAAKKMVIDDNLYLRNVVHNVNVRKVQKQITQILLEYMSTHSHDKITTTSCLDHVGDFYNNFADGGKHIRTKHRLFMRDTIQKILDKQINVAETPPVSDDEPEEEHAPEEENESEVKHAPEKEDESSSSGDESD